MAISFKKRIHLKDFDYKGCYRYFITICTRNKEKIFEENKEVVDWLLEVLKEKSIAKGFRIWVYCFMPDHLHLLVEGTDADSEMKKFVSSYKQLTSFSFKRKTGLPLWQINFYDHVLRKDEDTIDVVRYILRNPVRKGLVSDFREYRFLGSFELDIEEL